MAKVSRGSKLVLSAVLSVGILTAGGLVYRSHSADASSATPAAAPPPPAVNVVVMEERSIRLWKDFSGRLQSVDFVEIRPQVSGSLQEIRFQDGQVVNKGDILFVIDPAPYAASVAQAQASLQAAKNQLSFAEKELVRASDLVKADAISKRIYDERNNNAQVARAQVGVAQAQLNQAQIDLDHAYVKAPITGRVSRAELTQGNLVQAGQNAPVLTTIASNEGIYADFEIDEKTYLENIYSVARDQKAQAEVPVQMVLKSATDKTYAGFIKSFDNHIDPTTGTVRARAYFDNADGRLLPGMFVSVRLGNADQRKSIMISERAIGTDQDRKFVYVVGKDQKVIYREVEPGTSVEGQRVILSGLEPGDQVITDGIMKIRPNMLVSPQIASAK